MDSVVTTDREDDSVMTSPPPTRIITVKNQYTIKDQDEMLTLAQKKFDHMRQRNRERARSSRYQRLSRGGRLSKPNTEQTKIHQLFSSLLYLSLMMHKVDDMKKILEHRDSNLYNEWNVLLGSLHSPVFHLRERRIQNERVKKIFNRKDKYKTQCNETKTDLIQTQENLKQLSQALAKLTEDNQKAHLLLHEKHNVENDLASTKKESEMRQSHLVKQEDEISNLKSEYSQLRETTERLQTEQARLLQKIEDHEKNSEAVKCEIVKLTNDIDQKRNSIQDLKCQVLALEKDKDAQRMELTSAQSDHILTKESLETQLVESKAQWKDLQRLLEESRNDFKQLENEKSECILELQQQMTDAIKDAGVKNCKLQMTQEELTQAQRDLESKANSLAEAFNLIKAERNTNKCLEEKYNSNMQDLLSLSALVEKSKGENLLLVQAVDTLKEDLKNNLGKANEKVNSLEEELKKCTTQSGQAEKEVAVLKCANSSLEKSLSEALQLKASVEEEKQKLIDGEASSVNSSIEKLTTENLRITQIMGSMKDSLLQDVHNALEQQKLAEQKTDILQKQLDQTEKELAVLTCTNVSLEKSLSEALQLKSSVEEEKQKLIDGEVNSVNSSIEKLTADNLRTTQIMGSMKDSLMKDIHDALEQQKLAEQKADILQKQLVQTEKELAVLECTNSSLEKSLSEALKLKTSAEQEKQKLLDEETSSVNVSIEKLTAENLRLTQMMGSMKDSLIQNVHGALIERQEEIIKLQTKNDLNGDNTKEASDENIDRPIVEEEIDRQKTIDEPQTNNDLNGDDTKETLEEEKINQPIADKETQIVGSRKETNSRLDLSANNDPYAPEEKTGDVDDSINTNDILISEAEAVISVAMENAIDNLANK